MTDAPAAELCFTETRGWRVWSSGGVTVWWNGHAFLDGELLEGIAAAGRIGALLPPLLHNAASRDRLLLTLDGHFAFVVAAATGTLAVVDRVRSIPIIARIDPDGRLLQLSDNITTLLQPGDISDPDASLALAMSGYTLDGRTLYQNIRALNAGEALAALPGAPAQRNLWYAYQPWQVEANVQPDEWSARLTAAHEALFAKLVRSLDQRPVMLPLSGGFDSRLVVSGLHHAGYRNIICYSYGRPSNAEATAARAIAEKLGYPWHYVSYGHDTTQAALRSPDFQAYMNGADTGAAIPFFQDFAAIHSLKQQGLVPEDAIFINGNTGDFVSGNHVPLPIHDDMSGKSLDERWDNLTAQFITKHFSLWQDLRTTDKQVPIKRLLSDWLIRHVPRDLPADLMHAAWEALEYNARQSNFVINGQRVYEFFGHDWRLPLWDRDYVDFWQSVPSDQKRAQALYRRTLLADNWGGVWSGIPLNPPQRWHLPVWAKLLRNALKLASLPFGRPAWQQIDRRVFYYWIDVLATYATVPYTDVLFDRHGFRHALSFRGRDYLARHHRRYDGRPQ